jgi:Domain of unknown function (DUF3846)
MKTKKRTETKRTITVVVKEPGKDAAVVTVPDLELETMQKMVGGCIEHVPMGPGVVLVCNENGVGDDLPHDIGIYVGTIFFCGLRSYRDGYHEVGLSRENVRKVLAWCELHKNDPPRGAEDREFHVVSGDTVDAMMARIREHAAALRREWESL